MYVSARGQVEPPPGYNPSASTRIWGDDEDRPAKRQKKDGNKKKDRFLMMAEPPDAHEKAPDAIKNLYKRWQRMDKARMNAAIEALDCSSDPDGKSFPKHGVKEVSDMVPSNVQKALEDFMGGTVVDATKPRVFEVKSMPGLFIFPNFFPPALQIRMLDKLLHRDLSNPQHQTNVQLHYSTPYAAPLPHSEGPHASYFDPSAQAMEYPRKSTHAALDTNKMLDKKLRWMTLGGQYDWTNKVYPDGPPPPFPPDIKKLIDSLFPMKAEAAIVNLYSPGDTLSAHRDVSEACAQPLVSISLGCESVFIVGADDSPPPAGSADAALNPSPTPVAEWSQLKTAVLRLHSGDAVLMSGPSRYAWHGLPRVLPNTCPEYLQDWPAIGSEENKQRYAAYKGWMRGKRVNLNVRQMFSSPGTEDSTGAGATKS